MKEEREMEMGLVASDKADVVKNEWVQTQKPGAFIGGCVTCLVIKYAGRYP